MSTSVHQLHDSEICRAIELSSRDETMRLRELWSEVLVRGKKEAFDSISLKLLLADVPKLSGYGVAYLHEFSVDILEKLHSLQEIWQPGVGSISAPRKTIHLHLFETGVQLFEAGFRLDGVDMLLRIYELSALELVGDFDVYDSAPVFINQGTEEQRKRFQNYASS